MLISSPHKLNLCSDSQETCFLRNVFEKSLSMSFIGSKTTQLRLVVLNPITLLLVFWTLLNYSSFTKCWVNIPLWRKVLRDADNINFICCLTHDLPGPLMPKPAFINLWVEMFTHKKRLHAYLFSSTLLIVTILPVSGRRTRRQFQLCDNLLYFHPNVKVVWTSCGIYIWEPWQIQERILAFQSCDETAMLVYKTKGKCRSSLA